MGLFFQSIRSSSAGNCVMLWSQRSAIAIDCGIKTQWGCREALAERVGGPVMAGVIVTHAHSDHIGYPGLRTAAKSGVPVYVHDEVRAHLARYFDFSTWRPAGPEIRGYGCERFTVGEFEIKPMEVPHAPGCLNYGFVIHHEEEGERRKVVVCTDFYRYEDVIEQFVNADFIFVEANHDPELLRRFPNYASRFHMSNGKTAKLLREARRRSDFAPSTVMLGHLSNERNTEELALAAIREAFAGEPGGMEFELMAAPKFERSRMVEVRMAEAGLFGR